MKLIIDMPMPKHMCCDCEISIDGFACKKARTNGGKCPIVGVLPDEHGDLIDRDALKKQCWTDDGFDLWVSHTEIDQQPIVIAAERKDDD